VRAAAHYQDEPLGHILEASRWRVRKAFLREIITNEKYVILMTMNWQRLFPAMIGQDVTLARRHELMRLLDTLTKNKSTAATSRDAAVFWMGLIVLTDFEAFAAQRTRVRDMMLASDNPPMSLSSDVWMRVLNALIAFDDHEKITTFSSRLARDGMLLRRAVREGVRGIESQAKAVIHEIKTLDARGERAAAAALWLDLRLLIERADGLSEVNNTRQWLLETLAKWLMEDSDRELQERPLTAKCWERRDTSPIPAGEGGFSSVGVFAGPAVAITGVGVWRILSPIDL